jgi:flavin reductase (DIM6/NTAB) family NADH-FMN oxidoreductase RutF
MLLCALTVAWNTIVGGAAVATAVATGGLALIGFGLNAVVDSSASAILVWRFHAERSGHSERAKRAERLALRVAGVAFVMIALLVGAMRNVPTAVAMFAAHAGGIVHASTVSSATSVSRQPPLVLVCLSPESRALSLVREAGSFALSFLASGQDHLAAHFADPARDQGQFSEIPHSMTPFGPVIENAAATLACTLAAEHEGGDHRIVIGEVQTAAAADSHPLLRHAGAFK